MPLLAAYRRLSVAGITWRVMQRMLDRFELADEAIVTDHRRLVEAYESADTPYAKAVIVGHTERAKRAYLRIIELSKGQV
jgi:DNA-binding GntR family transcriptional regulator